MLNKDPYDILGVSPYATDEEVKRSYRELAKKYHPDRHVDNPLAELAQDKFREIQEAYDTVMSERQAGIPHQSYQNNNAQQGYYQNNRSPFGNYGQTNQPNQNQNYYNDYERRSQNYGGTNRGTDPCDCCMELWCLDSVCECCGGDLIQCC